MEIKQHSLGSSRDQSLHTLYVRKVSHDAMLILWKALK